jgi:phosphotransferase system HPr-like phosphotransfer protein
MVCRTIFRAHRSLGLTQSHAEQIAEAVAYFPGEIRVTYAGRVADAHDALELLSLRVPPGGWLVIESDRFDAVDVLERIRRLASEEIALAYRLSA